MSQTTRWTTVTLGGLLMLSAAVARSQLGEATPQAPTKSSPEAGVARQKKVVPVLVRKDATTKKARDHILVITVHLDAAPTATQLSTANWSVTDDSIPPNTLIPQADSVFPHTKGSTRHSLSIKFVISPSVTAAVKARNGQQGSLGTGNISIVDGSTGAPVDTVTPEDTTIDPCVD